MVEGRSDSSVPFFVGRLCEDVFEHDETTGVHTEEVSYHTYIITYTSGLSYT